MKRGARAAATCSPPPTVRRGWCSRCSTAPSSGWTSPTTSCPPGRGPAWAAPRPQLYELFGARLLATPYADGSGNSIQFIPVDESDADYRVIFETNGTTVTSMRAGRLPVVAPSEPCG